MSRSTIVSNSHFFARFEKRDGKIWLVWGNPNQETFNQALVKSTTLRSVRDWLCIITAEGNIIE